MARNPLHAYITYKSGVVRTKYYRNRREAKKALPKLLQNKKIRTAICYDGDKGIVEWSF